MASLYNSEGKIIRNWDGKVHYSCKIKSGSPFFLTNYLSKINSKYLLSVEIGNKSTSYQVFFGARTPDQKTRCWAETTPTGMNFIINSTGNIFLSNLSYDIANLSIEKDLIILNDKIISTSTNSNITESLIPISLFALNIGSSNIQSFSVGSTYHWDFIILETQPDGSEKEVRHYVFLPEGDTQYGFTVQAKGCCYCTITGETIYPSGTGEFEYTPIKQERIYTTVNGVTTPSRSVENDKGELVYFDSTVNDNFEVTPKEVGAWFAISDFISTSDSKLLMQCKTGTQLDHPRSSVAFANGTGANPFQYVGTWGNLTSGSGYYFGTNTGYPARLTEGSWHSLYADNTGLTVDGVKTVNFPTPYTGALSNLPLYIFSQNNSSTFATHPKEFYIAQTKLYQGDVLTHHLKPYPEGYWITPTLKAPKGGCLYNTIDGTVYPKQGTGSFEYKLLPRLGLKSLDGKQYINTGIKTDNCRIVNCNYSTEIHEGRGLMGVDYPSRYFGTNLGTKKFEINGAYIDMPINGNQVYNLKADFVTTGKGKSTLTVDGVTITSNVYPIVPGSTMQLYTLGYQLECVGGCYYDCLIYNYDGVLVQNLIPVLKGDSWYKPTMPAPSNCFYDTVTDTYLENKGTGTFEPVYTYF